MDKIKNILIAVELDDNSEVVLEYGITLGIMLDAHVRCLHVSRPLFNRTPYDDDDLPVENYSEYVLNNTESIDEMVEEDLVKLQAKVSAILKRMEIEAHPLSINVIPDFAVPGILNEADKTGADLIVVGAHVDYRKKDNAISNLSKKIIDDAKQSVIVVPYTYGNRNLDHICMFVNFEFGELNMIKDMIDMIRWNGLHLSFIHILESDEKSEEAEDKLNVYRRIFLDAEEDPLVGFKLVEGELTNIIDDLSNDLGVDLIGVSVKKKAWKMFNLEISLEDKVMEHLKVPLYVWK